MHATATDEISRSRSIFGLHEARVVGGAAQTSTKAERLGEETFEEDQA